MQSQFVHLGIRSCFSLSESMITAPALAEWLEVEGHPAAAVADISMFGALQISGKLSARGVQPIMACRFSVVEASAAAMAQPHALTLIAQNREGYERLMELSSAAFAEREGDRPELAASHLENGLDGLILLTGGAAGLAGRRAAKGDVRAVRDVLERWEQLCPGRTYVELTRHGTEDEGAAEETLLDAAYAAGLPIVATQDARFLAPRDATAHDVLMCISQGAYLSQSDRPRVSPDQYLKNAQEMRELFSDLPEACDATLEIASRCAVMAERHDPILPSFTDGSISEADALREMAGKGLAERLENGPLFAEESDYRERLDYELGVIEEMGFPGYFLIVADFIQWAKDRDIPVGPGRGSGAGSVVAWALTITDLDPLRFDLLFERFLNPARVSMPDFDIDFCPDRRIEVLRYVREKYGAGQVAAIITFGTLQAKAVVRDVGRVMQLPYGQVDRLAKLIPVNPAHPPTLSEAIAAEPRFAEEKRRDPRVAELLKIALSLEGLPRNASTHAAGVVLGDRPLTKLVPLYHDPRTELPVTQFDMGDAEASGLVKFDFLGLKNLTVIERTLELVAEGGGKVGPELNDMTDAGAYELMARGETLGVFQMESPGMRDTLRKVRPSNIEDVIAIISLYRPGPMQNIPVYVAGKEDPAKVRYQHPDLEPILNMTYGVPVYQEQVMRMAQELAGYSLGEADKLRRVMGKKKVNEVEEYRTSFVEGAVARKGMEEKLANEIFDTMRAFAEYGFNKSHAAAYALIAYQTAFLKAHFPTEFLAAWMDCDSGFTDRLSALVQEARRLGVEVEPPCINRSRAGFCVQDGAIRYGLAAVKGVGIEAMRHVEALRPAEGFAGLYDFAEAAEPKQINKRILESLAKSGAFDALEPNRARALASAQLLVGACQAAAQDRAGGQGGLFGNMKTAVRAPLPDTPPWTNSEKLDAELSAVGFYLSGHPLDDVFKALEDSRHMLISQINEEARDGRPIEVIALVRSLSQRPSRRGGLMGFVKLSDPTGDREVSIYEEALTQYRDLLAIGAAVRCTLNVRGSGEDIRLNITGVRSVDAKRLAQGSGGLRITLGRDAPLDRIASVAGSLRDCPRPADGALVFEVPMPGGGHAVIELDGEYPTDVGALRALKSLPGVDEVRHLSR